MCLPVEASGDAGRLRLGSISNFGKPLAANVSTRTMPSISSLCNQQKAASWRATVDLPLRLDRRTTAVLMESKAVASRTSFVWSRSV